MITIVSLIASMMDLILFNDLRRRLRIVLILVRKIIRATRKVLKAAKRSGPRFKMTIKFP